MSLESVPTYFSDFFDIPLEAGQAILGGVALFMFLFPVWYLSKGDRFASLATLLIIESALVAIGWFPFWLLIVTIVLLAAGFSKTITNNILGG